MKSLGSLEAAVMDRLWSWKRDASVREVLENLQRDREIAYTTVMTVLDNLHSKGFVTRTKAGRAFRYAAAAPRQAYTAELLDDVLGSDNDRQATLMHFVERLGEDERAQLRAMLKRPGGGG